MYRLRVFTESMVYLPPLTTEPMVSQDASGKPPRKLAKRRLTEMSSVVTYVAAGDMVNDATAAVGTTDSGVLPNMCSNVLLVYTYDIYCVMCFWCDV